MHTKCTRGLFCENGRVIPKEQTSSRKFVTFRKNETFTTSMRLIKRTKYEPQHLFRHVFIFMQVRKMSELINSMKLIKMYAWEKPFRTAIQGNLDIFPSTRCFAMIVNIVHLFH